MNSRLLNTVLVVGIASVTTGCEQPFDRSPSGYARACYGGESDAAKNWVCSDNRLVLRVEGSEAEWPALTKILSDFGRTRGLDVFDTSANYPNYAQTLNVSVCSAEGLFIYVDKRLYADASMNRDGKWITTEFRTYRDSFAWKPLAEDLVVAFQQSWPREVQVEWPEFIPAGEKRALPDSVESCD